MSSDPIEELSLFLSGDLKIPESGPAVLKKSLSHPSNHQHFIKLLTRLVNSYLAPGLQISAKINTTHDLSAWVSETQSLLDELGVPLSLEGSLNESTKLSLLSWIVEEIQCLRLRFFAEEQDGRSAPTSEDELRTLLKSSCIALSLSPPPPNLSPSVFFNKLNSSLLSQTTPLAPPILSQKLSPTQWETLEQLSNELNQEYSIRWVMLLARLDSTIQSFTWSNRLEDKKKILVEETYARLKRDLLTRPNVTLGDLLSASQASLRFEKLSSSKNKASSESSFAKVRMGRVPDRGGRPREAPAPPPEVPSWQQNNNRGGRGGGNQHQGRGRGGQRHHDNRNNYQGQQSAGGYGSNNQGHNNSQSQYNQGYSQGQYNQGYSQGQYNQGYSQGQYNQGYSQGQYNNQGYSQGQYNNQGQGQYSSQGYGRGGNHSGHRGRGGSYQGSDSSDYHIKKRRVQDKRF